MEWLWWWMAFFSTERYSLREKPFSAASLRLVALQFFFVATSRRLAAGETTALQMPPSEGGAWLGKPYLHNRRRASALPAAVMQQNFCP